MWKWCIIVTRFRFSNLNLNARCLFTPPSLLTALVPVTSPAAVGTEVDVVRLRSEWEEHVRDMRDDHVSKVKQLVKEMQHEMDGKEENFQDTLNTQMGNQATHPTCSLPFTLRHFCYVIYSARQEFVTVRISIASCKTQYEFVKLE